MIFGKAEAGVNNFHGGFFSFIRIRAPSGWHKILIDQLGQKKTWVQK